MPVTAHGDGPQVLQPALRSSGRCRLRTGAGASAQTVAAGLTQVRPPQGCVRRQQKGPGAWALGARRESRVNQQSQPQERPGKRESNPGSRWRGRSTGRDCQMPSSQQRTASCPRGLLTGWAPRLRSVLVRRHVRVPQGPSFSGGVQFYPKINYLNVR